MQSCKKISGNSATHKGGDMITQITMMLKAISTHATHKDGDDDKFEFYSQMITFQLTPPMWVATKCGKDDQDLESISTHASSTASRRHAKIFQLTPPIRAATTMFTSNGCSAGYFNSHHPCGWRRLLDLTVGLLMPFQLTPPMWVATVNYCTLSNPGKISTHTTHKGGDIP